LAAIGTGNSNRGEQELKRLNPFLTAQSLAGKAFINVPRQEVSNVQPTEISATPLFTDTDNHGDMQEASANSMTSFFQSVDESVSTLFGGFLLTYQDQLANVQSINPDLSNRLERNKLYVYSANQCQESDVRNSFDTTSTLDRPRQSLASLDLSTPASSMFEQPLMSRTSLPSTQSDESGHELKSLPLKTLYDPRAHA